MCFSLIYHVIFSPLAWCPESCLLCKLQTRSLWTVQPLSAVYRCNKFIYYYLQLSHYIKHMRDVCHIVIRSLRVAICSADLPTVISRPSRAEFQVGVISSKCTAQIGSSMDDRGRRNRLYHRDHDCCKKRPVYNK